MGNMVWQVGKSRDEESCALALAARYGEQRVVGVSEDLDFSSITRAERLHIVADFDPRTGTAGGLTVDRMAAVLLDANLRSVKHISLVICSSAERYAILNDRSFMEAFVWWLHFLASGTPPWQSYKCPFFVGMISGRFGFVNVFNQVMDEDPNKMLDKMAVEFHFINTNRELANGKKYSHQLPTGLSPDGFINKGFNKMVMNGFEVM